MKKIGKTVLTKRTINNRCTLSIFEGLCLVVVLYFISYMLLQDDIFPTSIDSTWTYFTHLARHFHILAVGLLPVYVALMIFGTAATGVYLGSAIQQWFAKVKR